MGKCAENANSDWKWNVNTKYNCESRWLRYCVASKYREIGFRSDEPWSQIKVRANTSWTEWWRSVDLFMRGKDIDPRGCDAIYSLRELRETSKGIESIWYFSQYSPPSRSSSIEQPLSYLHIFPFRGSSKVRQRSRFFGRSKIPFFWTKFFIQKSVRYQKAFFCTKFCF
jgi:hypothetical protein